MLLEIAVCLAHRGLIVEQRARIQRLGEILEVEFQRAGAAGAGRLMILKILDRSVKVQCWEQFTRAGANRRAVDPAIGAAIGQILRQPPQYFDTAQQAAQARNVMYSGRQTTQHHRIALLLSTALEPGGVIGQGFEHVEPDRRRVTTLDARQQVPRVRIIALGLVAGPEQQTLGQQIDRGTGLPRQQWRLQAVVCCEVLTRTTSIGRLIDIAAALAGEDIELIQQQPFQHETTVSVGDRGIHYGPGCATVCAHAPGFDRGALGNTLGQHAANLARFARLLRWRQRDSGSRIAGRQTQHQSAENRLSPGSLQAPLRHCAESVHYRPPDHQSGSTLAMPRRHGFP